MSFSNEFRDASINNGTLTVECKKADGQWVPTTLNLDDFIGNINGRLVLGAKGFSRGASDVTMIDGILVAKLKNNSEEEVEAKLDLGTLCYSKDDEFCKPQPVFTDSFRNASVDSNGTFTAERQNADGTWEPCIIELDDYIGNDNGKFDREGKSFSSSASDLKLSDGILSAKLKDRAGHIIQGQIYLYTARREEDGIFSHTPLDPKSVPDDVDQPPTTSGVVPNTQLSRTLSEVPWMKFKVVAVPDPEAFSSNPVVRHTMSYIAESTVEHVTHAMYASMTQSMEAAVVAVTASAMEHVSLLIEQSVEGVAIHVSGSPSETEYVHLQVDATES